MRGDAEICSEDRLRPVTVLGLGGKTDRLRQGGLLSLGDVLDDALVDFPRLRQLPAIGEQSVRLVRERLGAVASCVRPGGAVDWEAFDRLCGLGSTGQVTSIPPLSDDDRGMPVKSLHLGVRTTRVIAGGLTSVGDLFDDRSAGYRRLKNAPRLGDAAVGLVDRRLRMIDVCRAANGSVEWATFDALCRGQVVTPPPPPRAPPTLAPGARRRPVEVLRLGTKARFLRQAGVSTTGHLQRDEVQQRLSRIPGVGPGTAELIRTRLSQLEDSAGEDGEPLWDEVAAGWGFPVTPTHPLSTGEAFVEAAAGVISCWIVAHDTEADRLILGERLVRAREDRLKLEELGRRLGLTRERVRQREKKLLDGLCDALLADDQSASPVQFSADFRRWWEEAARVLSESPALTWPGFVSGLERAWGVPAVRLTAILPLALAVLTDGGQVVPPRTRIPSRLLEPLPPALLRRPLRAFPVGRAAGDLEEAGCTSFGGLLLAAMENRLPQGRSGEVGCRILGAVAAALDVKGEIDLARLALALGMPLGPPDIPTSGEAFLDLFDAAVEQALQPGAATERALEIWRVRTRHPAAIRPTLEETAAQLGTWGPTIKREETLLLAALNAQLVDGDQTRAAVVWRPEFLGFVAEAAEARAEAGGVFEPFAGRLSERWAVDETRLWTRAAGLWAVLSLYPDGRRRPIRKGRGSAPAPAIAEDEAPGLIVLRGFRRVH